MSLQSHMSCQYAGYIAGKYAWPLIFRAVLQIPSMDSSPGLSNSDSHVDRGEYGHFSEMLHGNSGKFSFDKIFTQANLFQDPFNHWAQV